MSSHSPKNHPLTWKVKGRQAWKPAVAKVKQTLRLPQSWLKSRRHRRLLQQPFSHPGLHLASTPPAPRRVSQLLCCYRSTASPTKQHSSQQGSGICAHFCTQTFSTASHDSLMQSRSMGDKGMQGTGRPIYSTDLQMTLCTRLFRKTCFSQHGFLSC